MFQRHFPRKTDEEKRPWKEASSGGWWLRTFWFSVGSISFWNYSYMVAFRSGQFALPLLTCLRCWASSARKSPRKNDIEDRDGATNADECVGVSRNRDLPVPSVVYFWLGQTVSTCGFSLSFSRALNFCLGKPFQVRSVCVHLCQQNVFSLGLD